MASKGQICVFFWTFWWVPSAADRVQPVHLVMMAAQNEDHDFGYARAAPVVQLAVEDLQDAYRTSMAFVLDAKVPKAVDDCLQNEATVAFTVTKRYYGESGKNATLAFFGPGLYCAGMIFITNC